RFSAAPIAPVPPPRRRRKRESPMGRHNACSRFHAILPADNCSYRSTCWRSTVSLVRKSTRIRTRLACATRWRRCAITCARPSAGLAWPHPTSRNPARRHFYWPPSYHPCWLGLMARQPTLSRTWRYRSGAVNGRCGARRAGGRLYRARLRSQHKPVTHVVPPVQDLLYRRALVVGSDERVNGVDLVGGNELQDIHTHTSCGAARQRRHDLNVCRRVIVPDCRSDVGWKLGFVQLLAFIG